MVEKKTKSGVILKKKDLEEKFLASELYKTLSASEQEYQRNLWLRLLNMRDDKNTPFDELDNMTVNQYVEFNTKRANTYVPPRKNSSDSSLVAGLAREKELSIASHIQRLNLTSEVHSFDKNGDKDHELSRSFTNMIKKSKEIEDDEEKDLLRTMMLMEEGTCVVEEAWVPSTKTRKKIVNKKALDPAKGFAGLEWTSKHETTYRAESSIVSLSNVLWGNIGVLGNEQPYMATVEKRNYDEVAAIFRDWPMWKYVKPGKGSGERLLEQQVMYRDISLYATEENEVEIVKYQDPINDEYQIIVNGVFMLPMGFPMPWEFEGGSLVWQVNEPISPYFALGKSLMAKIGRDDEMLTLMLRMFFHKTAQSAKPPVGNMTGKKLPPNIFDPARIWNGINPAQIGKLIEHQGVTNSEWQMFNMLREFIDSKSISRIAQGQQLSRSATATEILELQRQAKINIMLSLFAKAQLEKKIAEKRLGNLLTNWTQAEEESFDEVSGKINKRFKKIVINGANLGGKQGVEKIEFTDKELSFKEKDDMAKSMFMRERSDRGKEPMRMTVISTSLLDKLKFTHYIKVNPSEEESDNLNKILFGEEYTQAAQFFGQQSLNQDFYKKKFARVWGNNPLDVFNDFGMKQLQQMMQDQGQGQGAQSGTQGTAGQMMERGQQSAVSSQTQVPATRELLRQQIK